MATKGGTECRPGSSLGHPVQGACDEYHQSGVYQKWAYIFGTLSSLASSTHPWPAIRTKEIAKFHGAERYRSIIARSYPEAEEEPEGILASEGVLPSMSLESVAADLSWVSEDVIKTASGYAKGVSSYLRRKLKDATEAVERDNED